MTARIQQPCPDCAGVLVPATRYAGAQEPEPVLCCFECGRETPRLYRRSRRERNGEPYVLDAVCAGCGHACGRRRRDQQPVAVYCSELCSPGPPVPLRRSA